MHARTALMCATTLMTLGTAAVANAQTRAAPAADDRTTTTVADLIVTAQRREERLQDVPIAVSAFDQEQLQRANIVDASALETKVPGLVFGTFGGVNSQITIRGVGMINLSLGGEVGVQYAIDGVILGRPGAANAQFYDLQSVEVLRGPQGTLFGRNASGGVINVSTARPTSEFGTTAEVLAGNYDHLRLVGAANLPLSSRAALRISAVSDSHDGYARNPHTGRQVEDEHYRAARARFLWEPTDSLEVLLGADVYRQRNDGGFLHLIALNNTVPVGELNRAQGGTQPPAPLTLAGNPKINRFDAPEAVRTKVSTVFGTVTWTGPITVKSITAYSENRFFSVTDSDGTQINLSISRRDDTGNQFSQELQFLSPPDETRLTWVLGLFYFRENDGFLAGFQSQPGLNIALNGKVTSESMAAYGQATYQLTPQLRLTAGLRYTYDKKRAIEIQDLRPLLPVVRSLTHDDDKWDAWTPKVGIDFKVTPEVMLYATASRGYQAGGYNLGALQATSYNPEFIWAYEVGAKSQFLDDRLLLNVAAFHYDYQDLIVSAARQNVQGAVFPFLENAGSADINGAEIEMAAVPVEGLTLRGSLAYLDAKYSEYSTIDTAVCIVFNPANPLCAPVDLSGNRIPRSPEWTASASVEYVLPVGDGREFTFLADTYWRDTTNFSVFNRPIGRAGSHTRSNLRVRYGADDRSWALEGFIENVENDRRIVNASGSGIVTTRVFYSSPRLYGVRVLVRAF